MSVQRRERSHPRKDRASDCGVRGAHGDQKRGASGEHLEGRDRGKNCFSGEKVIAVLAYLMSTQRRERPQRRRKRASDCGVRGARGYRKQGACGERLVGRDREKFSSAARRGFTHPSSTLAAARLTSDAGMVSPISNCGPSVFDVSPAQGAIATAEGSGQQFDRKRWASGERLAGRDSGKKLLQRR
ncbi:Hypothetical predicted protein [Olea europaea subsp. europaea]|uniref:Uncharacterized protein n=1 Tax=Olea europaea subsp. europaea TaxID=158383 RepID=A0A8S0RS35_OLEEU|nr:Hypothetical predicted protein [Olea europaea subsp. europaea]